MILEVLLPETRVLKTLMLQIKLFEKMSQFWILLAIVASLSSPITGKQKPPIKNGFYRISNELDNGYLTATKHPGRPHEVITDEWKSIPEQEWKVKTNFKGGSPLQIIRNEAIRDNEVTKEEGENPGELIQVDWNLIANPAEPGYFEVNNGIGCLESQGLGKEIKVIDDGCDQTLPGQQWKFEFLFEIPPTKSTAE